MQVQPEDVLKFWFGSDVGAGFWREKRATWWTADADLDESIRMRFGETLESALHHELGAWRKTLEGAMALVIVLDQFCRNAHRGSSKAFAGDALSLPLAAELIARGDDATLHPIYRRFLYVPFMHSEDLVDQERSVELYRIMAAEGGEAEEIAKPALPHAIQHRDIVEQFGRFPHRNAILGRESTSEEILYLKGGGARFGQ